MTETQEITRNLPFTIERSTEDGDGLTLSGYAAVFNQVTRVDSWEGTFDEVILPGAFEKSLRERTPVLMFDHGHHPLIGNIPIGRYTDVHEDARGVAVEARLHNNWLTEPIRDAVRERSITGMSFRFLADGTVDRWTRRDDDVPLREIVRTVVPEMGPVVFPAYEGTEVAVRTQINVNFVEAPEPATDDDHALTGQDRARSSTGGDVPTPEMLGRHRALLLKGIIHE